jgi:Xaa-Pro aminopeptidase
LSILSYCRKGRIWRLLSWLQPTKVRFLAHGIGIELSEFPFIAANHKLPYRRQGVFAIEPKMVFPKKGACGIENTVLIEGGVDIGY